jgi:uncharacterized SAM-binding protein YcdF (DUF218 family)
VWLFSTALLTRAASLLIEDDGAQKAQVAEVLGGDDSGARITKAAQLAQAGYVPYVLVDGPKALMGHESDILIRYAVQKGYQPSLFRALPLPDGMNSTREETAFSGKYLKQHGIHKILLVTSNYHTRRAAYLMRKQNPGLQVIAVAATDPQFTPTTWWKSREGKKIFLLEWMKTVANYLGV